MSLETLSTGYALYAFVAACVRLPWQPGKRQHPLPNTPFRLVYQAAGIDSSNGDSREFPTPFDLQLCATRTEPITLYQTTIYVRRYPPGSRLGISGSNSTNRPNSVVVKMRFRLTESCTKQRSQVQPLVQPSFVAVVSCWFDNDLESESAGLWFRGSGVRIPSVTPSTAPRNTGFCGLFFFILVVRQFVAICFFSCFTFVAPDPQD